MSDRLKLRLLPRSILKGKVGVRLPAPPPANMPEDHLKGRGHLAGGGPMQDLDRFEIYDVLQTFTSRIEQLGASPRNLLDTEDNGKFLINANSPRVVNLPPVTGAQSYAFYNFNNTLQINAVSGAVIIRPQGTTASITLQPLQSFILLSEFTNWLAFAVSFEMNDGSISSGMLRGNGAKANIEIVIDGGGSIITTGVKADLEVGFSGTITKATLLADQVGSIVMDIWKDSYGNYPPTVADSITASAKPTLSSAAKSQDVTLTGWATSFNAGDTFRFNVDSASLVRRVTLSLECQKVW
jgi:hypothetical protein